MVMTLDRILDFETGTMEHEEIVDLFQDLVDTGLVWILNGPYAQVATEMIEKGFITDEPPVRQIEG